MRQLDLSTFALTAAALPLGIASTSSAATLVNDTWLDGTRTDPTAANGYSENGTDGDADGNLESAWFQAGGAGHSVAVVPGTGLRATQGATSSNNLTTYFTPESSPVTLVAAGDQIRITWVFTPTGVAAGANNTGFRIGVVDSPAANRLTANGTPPGNTTNDLRSYPGYAMIGNMGTTLGNSNPFGLYERVADGDFLTNTNNTSNVPSTPIWASRNDQENANTVGYADGVTYTFVFTATRTAADALDITMTMTGGDVGNAGTIASNTGDDTLNAAFLDTTPASFTFDTFGIRLNGGQTATTIDTSLFQVEFVPEPASLALIGLGGLAIAGRRRG